MPKVRGLKELDAKLNRLEAKVAAKTLRSAALQATTPALKTMKAAAPRGKQLHRTYKGNLVAPGFLSRSIKRKTTLKYGRAKVIIGVKKEAHYGVNFVEKGTRPHRIPSKGRARLKFGGGVFSSVNHPGARPKPWFKKSFVASERAMIRKFSEVLNKRIMEAVR